MSDLHGPLHNHIATTYGVTEKSVLNDSRYFHVVSSLVPDVMHDMLEGTTQFTMKCLLQHLIGGKYFSRDDLNRRIVSFDYGQVAAMPHARHVGPGYCRSLFLVKQRVLCGPVPSVLCGPVPSVLCRCAIVWPH